MKNLTPEMIEKARNCGSVEELMALAKENGVEMDLAEARACYSRIHPKAGVLADEELEGVSGGGCGSSGSGSSSKWAPGEPYCRVSCDCESFTVREDQGDEYRCASCDYCGRGYRVFNCVG